MELNEILSRCDHTLLTQTATWDDIRAICDDGMKYRTASVCIPPCFVGKAKNYVGDRLKICTVIGFPNGYSTTAVKLYETADALANGADEIDMVINLGDLRSGRDETVLDEISALKRLCGDRVLKVIIETCLLTDDEKYYKAFQAQLHDWLENNEYGYGANFKCGQECSLRVVNAFSTGGATREDVRLMRENVGTKVRVKAAGGISDLADAEDFIALGADRLGTSRVVKAVKALESAKK